MLNQIDHEREQELADIRDDMECHNGEFQREQRAHERYSNELFAMTRSELSMALASMINVMDGRTELHESDLSNLKHIKSILLRIESRGALTIRNCELEGVI